MIGIILCHIRSVASCKELVNGVAGNPITEKVMFYTAYMLARVTSSAEAGVAMEPWPAFGSTTGLIVPETGPYRILTLCQIRGNLLIDGPLILIICFLDI